MRSCRERRLGGRTNVAGEGRRRNGGGLVKWLPWLALVVVVAVALMLGADRGGGPETVSQRTERLSRSVRCPTCRDLSAAESDAAAAKAVRLAIRRDVEAGRTDVEIRAGLASRYGRDILLTPDSRGVVGLVWVLPVAAVVIGLGGLALAFRRWRPARPAPLARRPRPRRGSTGRMTETDDREFLLRSIRDLEAERDRRATSPPDDYANLRDDYTARAAAALRGEPATTAPIRRSWIVFAGILVLAIGAGLVVANSAGERTPTDALTGSITASTNDRLARASELIAAGKAVDALKMYDQIHPRRPEATRGPGVPRLAGPPGRFARGGPAVHRASHRRRSCLSRRPLLQGDHPLARPQGRRRRRARVPAPSSRRTPRPTASPPSRSPSNKPKPKPPPPASHSRGNSCRKTTAIASRMRC